MCQILWDILGKKESSRFDTLILSIKKDGTILSLVDRLIIVIYQTAKRKQ